MTLSRKHYELIAEVIREAQPSAYPEAFGSSYQVGFEAGASFACEVVATQLADKFQQLSPQFNRARFLEACGVPA